MGQIQSFQADVRKFTPQEVSSRFANRAASQLSGIELWAFKDVYRQHAKVNGGSLYWTAESFEKFLELPESVNESGKMLYSMVSYLCLFPFLRPRTPPLVLSNNAPSNLTFENIVKVVILFSGRYKPILSGDYDFLKLIFLAIAYHEDLSSDQDGSTEEKFAMSEKDDTSKLKSGESTSASAESEKMNFFEKKLANLQSSVSSLASSSVTVSSSKASIKSESTDNMDDEMLTINLESINNWYDLDLIKSYDNLNVEMMKISPTSIYHLLILLLALGALQPQEPISTYADHFEDPKLANYKRIAASMTRSFDPKWTVGKLQQHGDIIQNGISYSRFFRVVRSCMPFAFDGLATLFDRFLFNRRIAPETSSFSAVPTRIPEAVFGSPVDHPYASSADHDGLEENMSDAEEIIQLPSRLPEPTKLMNAATIAQLSSFMDINSFQLYGSLRKLYAGSEAGFSMGSFEQKVFKWNAPTIVLVSGYLLSKEPKGARERAFCDQIPPVRYPNSASMLTKSGGMVTYGAVVTTPWKSSHKECFADSSTALFQLEPVQDVFRAAKYNSNYAYFSKNLGVGFGSPPPKVNSHQNHGLPQYHLGNMSLTLEHSLEFGIFRNLGSETFRASDIREYIEFEDRFAITELEVWGCGADEVLKEQARLWAWEEREALRRKNVNLSKDIEESRALLELAGLVNSGNRSGGSV
ncbi:TLD-domain-containing protein [Dipodascopsis uninucleata]